MEELLSFIQEGEIAEAVDYMSNFCDASEEKSVIEKWQKIQDTLVPGKKFWTREQYDERTADMQKVVRSLLKKAQLA